MAERPRVLYLVTEDWYFRSHRLSLGRAARRAGFEVIIATRVGSAGRDLCAEGFRLIPIRLRRSGVGPLEELRSLVELVRIYRRERPAIVHHVALKPVVYGSIAARIARAPAVVNAVAGLGHVFISRGIIASLRRTLLRIALRLSFAGRRTRVIFQNPEDRAALLAHGVVRADRAELIRGVGVDLDLFSPRPEPEGPPLVLLAARLLWSKGVGEFVEAAKALRSRGRSFRAVLAGEPDYDNARAVPLATLESWRDAGDVEWWGRCDDMPSVLAAASIVVLPTTYGEGVPKVLIEAAAAGRPIVATDVPGCREVVRDGENGFLVPPGDRSALASAIERLCADASLRARLGAAGRRLAETGFSDTSANELTLDVYRRLLEVGDPARKRDSVPGEDGAQEPDPMGTPTTSHA